MAPEAGIRLRGTPVIHDTIDNETIAINQRTGRYYSLDGAAAAAWQALDSGTTPARLSTLLNRLYDVEPSVLDDALATFLAALRAEELIVDATVEPSANTAARGASTAPANAAGETSRPPFPGLALHHYSDMEVLLLADPIHEVDETGWPTPLPTPEP